jgi:hypothetical protein
MASGSNGEGRETRQVKRYLKRKGVFLHISVERNDEFKATTRNYVAPLRQADMHCAAPDRDDMQEQQQTSSTAGRPPPIVLTHQLTCGSFKTKLRAW